MNLAKVFILLFVGTAVGCLVWLSFAEGAHDFRRQLGIEDRHAEAVGANPLPKDALKISIKSNRDGCMVIDKAEFDGDRLWINWRAVCPETFQRLAWKEFAPDGTSVNMGYEWIISGQSVSVGDKGQFGASEYSFHLDPRAVTLELECYRR